MKKGEDVRMHPHTETVLQKIDDKKMLRNAMDIIEKLTMTTGQNASPVQKEAMDFVETIRQRLPPH